MYVVVIIIVINIIMRFMVKMRPNAMLHIVNRVSKFLI